MSDGRKVVLVIISEKTEIMNMNIENAPNYGVKGNVIWQIYRHLLSQGWHTKIRIYKVKVISILIYGHESWYSTVTIGSKFL